MNEMTCRRIGRKLALAVLTTAFGSVLVACGGSGSEEAQPSAPSSSAAPTYAESEGCRNEMKAIEAMATTLEGQALDDAERLAPFVRQIAAVQKRVKAACSTTVYDPLAEASYQLALAGARAQACEFVSLCDKKPITKSVVAASAAMRQSLTESDRKS